MTRFLTRPVIVPGRHGYDQAELSAAFRARLEDVDGSATIRKVSTFVHARSGIERRHFELGLNLQGEGEGEGESKGWYQTINESTLSLAMRGLAQAGRELDPLGECDGLVVASSTFAGFPSLSRQLQQRMGLALDALCFDLGGLGCAAPTHALHLADMLVASGRCRQVCVVCVDAMGTFSEARRHQQVPDMAQVVAHCLASDGVAVTMLSAAPSDATILAYDRAELESSMWSDSLGENDLTASRDGQPYMAVGKAIRTRLAQELGPLIATLPRDSTLFHPGGARLIETIAGVDEAFLPTLEVSKTVLREQGNLGAPSVMWVLAEAVARGRPLGPNLSLVALGPGIVSAHLRLCGVEVLRAAA